MPIDRTTVINKNYRCIICGSSNFKFLFKGRDRVHEKPEEFNVFQCRECDLVFLWPVPYNLDFYYPEDYYAYKLEKKNHFYNFKEKILYKTLKIFFDAQKRNIWDYLLYPFFYLIYLRILYYPKNSPSIGVKKKVLDVGCGTGKMLNRLKKIGWEVYGNDFSISACQIARENGVENILPGKFEEVDYPENFFDCVCINNTLEHMRNPVFVLNKIYKILRKGGELIITLPNYNSLSRKIFGRHDVIFDIPRHLYLFNYTNLGLLLKKVGFEIRETYTMNLISGLHHNIMYTFNKKPQKIFFLDKFMGILDTILECFFPKNKKFGNQLILKCRKI